MPTRRVKKKAPPRKVTVKTAHRPAHWKLRPSGGLQILEAPPLARFGWLVHGFSTRPGGASELTENRNPAAAKKNTAAEKVLNLGFTVGDSRERVLQNRAKFFAALGASGMRVVALRQIHSDIVHLVSAAQTMQSEPALQGDALITREPGILLTIQTADCIPVLVADRKNRAVAAFHAGWRGTVKRIVEKGVGEMRRWFGTLPKNVKAAIGPGIHACCYDVGPEVRQQFESQFGYAEDLFREIKESDPVREKYPLLFLTARAPGHSELPTKIFLDLVEANRRQLIDAGVAPKNISASPLCTACHTNSLFSYRREKGATGRMMAVAGIRPRGKAQK